MTKRSELAKEYSLKLPNLNNAEVGRILHKNYPLLFRSAESARKQVVMHRMLDNPQSSNNTSLLPDEIELIEKYRESKSILEKECNSAGINISEVKHYWYKQKHFSIFAKPNQRSLDELKAEMMEGMKNYSPTFPKLKREKVKDGHCLVIDPADIHIGKLATAYETGNEYNVKIAIDRVIKGVDGILQKASGFSIDQIVLIIGNDILHTDNARRSTTSGTPQDTDGQWYDNFLIAQELYVTVVTKLLGVAKVHIVHNVSNHDYMTGWFLAQIVQTWFRKCKDITFDCDMKHRKAFVYHDNLIATTHGDGAKQSDLNSLLAHEFPMEWSKTKYRYIYTHHIHHKTSKDVIGVTIESSRSASGTDGWHHRNGYTGAVKAIEAYLHSKNQGQVARFSHIFK